MVHEDPPLTPPERGLLSVANIPSSNLEIRYFDFAIQALRVYFRRKLYFDFGKLKLDTAVINGGDAFVTEVDCEAYRNPTLTMTW
jgi:hypothetical protein